MPTRTAKTAWTGGLQDGSGRVEFASSGLGSFDVSFPKRISDTADGTTSPEELIAAAHSACFAMALSAGIGAAGGTPQSLSVSADVTMGPDSAGGFRLTRSALTVRAKVDGLDADGFAKAAEGAKTGCLVRQGAERRRNHAGRSAGVLKYRRASRWYIETSAAITATTCTNRAIAITTDCAVRSWTSSPNPFADKVAAIGSTSKDARPTVPSPTARAVRAQRSPARIRSAIAKTAA